MPPSCSSSACHRVPVFPGCHLFLRYRITDNRMPPPSFRLSRVAHFRVCHQGVSTKPWPGPALLESVLFSLGFNAVCGPRHMRDGVSTYRLAGNAGFEPAVPPPLYKKFGASVFKTAAISRSANSPCPGFRRVSDLLRMSAAGLAHPAFRSQEGLLSFLFVIGAHPQGPAVAAPPCGSPQRSARSCPPFPPASPPCAPAAR